jgi:hypothetical protein
MTARNCHFKNVSRIPPNHMGHREMQIKILINRLLICGMLLINSTKNTVDFCILNPIPKNKSYFSFICMYRVIVNDYLIAVGVGNVVKCAASLIT